MVFLSLISLIFLILRPVFSQTVIIGPLTAGINTSTGQRPYRKDINDLQGPELDLYLLTLQQMQQADERDKLSWFQVSGIHGLPAVSWNEVRAWNTRLTYPGYAIHNCELFLPWHRAYLVLLENLVAHKAMDIARSYPAALRDEYIQAARNLRLPYWKWDGPSLDIPHLVKSKQVSVLAPSGNHETIKNPLESYVFHPSIASADQWGDTNLGKYPRETVRQPDESGQSNYDWVLGNWTYFYGNSREMLFQRFTEKDSSFFSFAFAGMGTAGSLELIHGALHSATGGYMYDLWTSAFDPIFYLHHANVDRLWAIWAAIHPHTYIQPRNCGSQTFAQRAGIIENASSPLYPFRNNTIGGFHTPGTVRNEKDLGYAYEEVPDWLYTDKDQLANYVLSVVHTMYGQPANKAKHTSPTKNSAQTLQWMIDLTLNINSDIAANVFFFFGTPPARQGEWKTEKNLVFAQAFLRSTLKQPRFARIPINRYLLEAISKNKLKDLLPQSVQLFLTQNLQWRVVAHGSSAAFNMQADRQVSVNVVEQKVLSAEKGLMQYGPVTVHGNLTWA